MRKYLLLWISVILVGSVQCAHADDERCFATIQVPKYQVTLKNSIAGAGQMQFLPDGTALNYTGRGTDAFDSSGKTISFPAWVNRLPGNPDYQKMLAANPAVHLLPDGTVIFSYSGKINFLKPDGSAPSVSLPAAPAPVPGFPGGWNISSVSKNGVAASQEVVRGQGNDLVVSYSDGHVNGPYAHLNPGSGAKTGLVNVAFLSDDTAVLALAGEVRFISPDGKISGDYKASGFSPGNMSVMADDSVVFGSTDGRVYFVNSDGSVKTVFSSGLQNTAFTKPAVEPDGTIVIAENAKGTLFLVHPDGTGKAAYIAKSQEAFSDPMLMQDGTIVLAQGNSGLTFLGPDGTLKAHYDFPAGFRMSQGPALSPDGTVELVINQAPYGKSPTLNFLSLDPIPGQFDKRRVQVPGVCPNGEPPAATYNGQSSKEGQRTGATQGTKTDPAGSGQ